MATEIWQVREALAYAVEASGLKCSPYLSDSINAPCAFVDRRQMDPRMVFSQSSAVYRFAVRCYFRRSAEKAAQRLMDEHCELSGQSSVLAAIQDENNWPDALVDYAEVVSIGDTLLIDVAGTEYLTVEFLIEVVW